MCRLGSKNDHFHAHQKSDSGSFFVYSGSQSPIDGETKRAAQARSSLQLVATILVFGLVYYNEGTQLFKNDLFFRGLNANFLVQDIDR